MVSKKEVIVLYLCVLTGWAAAYTISPWVPKFKGVHHAVGDSGGTPRPQKVNAIRIDLYDPDIHFTATPSNGAGSLDTDRQTASQFMASSGAQICVNSSFFIEATATCANLDGLAICEGNIVSAAETLPHGGRTLLITQDNIATFLYTTPSTNLSGYWTAVESWPYFLSNGNNTGDMRVAPAYPEFPPEPRTAVGLTQDNRYLIIITIDGDPLNAGYSEGASPWETADWLKRFGAYNGLNFDGGGSTHLWICEYGGSTYSLNSPSENRAVGNHLGVYAAPLPPIEYADSRVFADFENGNESTFNQVLTYTGSGTYGIAGGASKAEPVNTESFRGGWSQRLYIYDNPTQSGGWFVRHLSGLGLRTENAPCHTTGFVGLWAKTSTTGCEITIAIDNTNDVTADRGIFKPIIADGLWHLYEWNLEDGSDWEAWQNGDGVIDTADFTVDSIQLRCSSDKTATIYIDEAAHHSRLSLAYLHTNAGDFQPDGCVNLYDFALLAEKWLLTSDDIGFERLYDLSDPADSIIDDRDLRVFLENWLFGAE